MAAVRPTVTVFNAKGEAESSAKLPAVFTAPIRIDIVQFVHSNVAKNKRQPYAVSVEAGYVIVFSLVSLQPLLSTTTLTDLLR